MDNQTAYILCQKVVNDNDQEAYQKLLDYVTPTIGHRCTHYSTDLDDAKQYCRMLLFTEVIPKYNKRSAFISYAWRVFTYRLCSALTHKSQLLKTRSITDMSEGEKRRIEPEYKGTKPNACTEPNDAAARVQQLNDAVADYDSFDDQVQQVWKLWAAGDKPAKIAKELSLSAKAVDNRVMRVKLWLRERFGDEWAKDCGHYS